MRFKPSENLSEEEVTSKLKLIIRDGLATELMSVLSGGAFLVAFALKLGATNFQIGVLASLGTLASVLQLLGIYLIQVYKNRRGIIVYFSIIARTSLILIACLPFLFAAKVSLSLIMVFLFVHYVLGAVAGLCWTSWMKDLLPEKSLGTFFAKRSQLIQILSICGNFGVALALDYVRATYPEHELLTYSAMFCLAAFSGLYGVYLLAVTPEPRIHITDQNIFKLLLLPFKNINFKNLMVFHSLWLFAINLASPFFTVYLLKTLNYPLSYVISLSIISQVTNVFFITIWGRYTDKYSNKSVLAICAPVYLLCILAWTFTTFPGKHYFTMPLLILIHLFSGVSVSGINLALSNIGLKLAPRGNGVYYISAKSILTAIVGGIAPLAGGLFADFFDKRELSLDLTWKSPTGNLLFHTIDIQQWDFFFVLAFFFGLISLYLLGNVKEEGDVQEKVIVADLVREFKTLSTADSLRAMIYIPVSFFSSVRKKIRSHTSANKQPDAKPTSAVFPVTASSHSALKELQPEK